MLLLLCVSVSKSGFNLFKLPSHAALWFMNKFDASNKKFMLRLIAFLHAETKDERRELKFKRPSVSRDTAARTFREIKC